MAEAKPTASLSSGLLARKGAARPAMRRQGLGGHIAVAHDDLGWNDMGHDPHNDEHENHAAHVADIMPMLSPMGAKPVALVPQHAAADVALEGPDEDEAPDDIAVAVRSPLSAKPVKPGKPPVVLQRESLEERVRAPAPTVPAARVETPVSEEPAIAESSPRSAAAGQAQDVEQVTADLAPILAATPKPAPPARKPAKAARATRTPSRRVARAAGAKAAFTLRIDADRHLRLRLASALTNLSAQQILTEAFDAYLETIPEVEALAGNVARHKTDRS